eukprot:7776489-Ditylum_brightwellii.AAC.1
MGGLEERSAKQANYPLMYPIKIAGLLNPQDKGGNQTIFWDKDKGKQHSDITGAVRKWMKWKKQHRLHLNICMTTMNFVGLSAEGIELFGEFTIRKHLEENQHKYDTQLNEGLNAVVVMVVPKHEKY